MATMRGAGEDKAVAQKPDGKNSPTSSEGKPRNARTDEPVKESTSAAILNFISQNFATLLTAVAALVAATFTLSGTVFKENQPPTAEIRAFAYIPMAPGYVEFGTSPAIEDSKGNVSNTTATIPEGMTLVAFSGNSNDPDGDSQKLTFCWSNLPDKSGGCAKTTETTDPTMFSWTPSKTGPYMLKLLVIDNQDCPPWRNHVFGSSGCQKSITRTLPFVVVPKTNPNLQVSISQRQVKPGEEVVINLDDRLGLDGSPADLKWSLNGQARPTVDKASNDIRFAAPNNAGIYDVSIVATDRFGLKAHQSVLFEVRLPETQAAAPAKGNSGSNNTELCSGLGEYELSAPISINDPNATCSLPALLKTNGKSFSLQVKQIVANNSRIVAFDPRVTQEPKGTSETPSGRAAGAIVLVATDFTGALTINNDGERGGDGSDGGAGMAGSTGSNGSNAASGLFDCRRGAERGGNGGNGQPGQKGGNAGSGGGGGLVDLNITNFRVGSRIDVTSFGGAGGIPGKGGPGGPGGPGGSGGSPIGLCSGSGPNGLPGQNGPSGPSGQPASTGENGTIRVFRGDQQQLIKSGSATLP